MHDLRFAQNHAGVLAFDTSTDNVTVAGRGTRLCWRRRRMPRTVAEGLVGLFEEVSRGAGLFEETTVVIGVGLGPGSLTSLRVGLAAAKALAWAKQWPLVGFNSLDLLAAGVSGRENALLWVVRDARRDNVYTGEYEKSNTSWKPVRPCALMKQHAWVDRVRARLHRHTGPLMVVVDPPGFQVEGLREMIKAGDVRLIERHSPRPSDLVRLTEQSWRNNGPIDPETISPLYLYADDCQVRSR